jgi:uncharacterized SAM-binding protein YcdF (DUF218 family)
MRKAARRTLVALTIALTCVLAWAFVDAGRYLQHEDPLQHADALFVLAGARLERTFEAVDLYQAGYAPVILFSPGGEEPAESVARARGLRVPRYADTVRDAVVAFGVPREAMIVPDVSVDNTAQEAALLRTTAAQRGWHTVIVVTSKYHTRRSGFAMRRELEGSGVRILVRASRYDLSDPARWWRQRADVRYLMEEWPKLVAYRLGLGE